MRLTNADNAEAIMRGIRLNNTYVIGFGWSRTKGDWWWQDSPQNAKFFDFRKKDNIETNRYGIYIGRLALVLIKKNTIK